MVYFKVGSVFDSKMDVLVNPVNLSGVCTGLSKNFAKRFPNTVNDYIHKCNNEALELGIPYLYCESVGKKVLIFPIKESRDSNVDLEHIECGLKWICDNYKELNIKSIAMTALGCGLNGLSFKKVAPLLHKHLQDLSIDVEVYVPSEVARSNREIIALPCLFDLRTVDDHFNIIKGFEDDDIELKDSTSEQNPGNCIACGSYMTKLLSSKNSEIAKTIVQEIYDSKNVALASKILKGMTFTYVVMVTDQTKMLISLCFEHGRDIDVSRAIDNLEFIEDLEVTELFKKYTIKNETLKNKFEKLLVKQFEYNEMVQNL